MYNEICNFAKLKGLSVKKNRKTSKISCYVILDSDGNYLGLDVPDKKSDPTLIPDFGSYAATQKYANAIVEKCVNIFDTGTIKHKSYMEVMERGIDSSVSLCAIHTFLSNYETDSVLCDRVQADLKSYGIKDNDVVSFSIDGVPVEDMEDDWNDWLLEQIAAFHAGKSDVPLIISSISGELQESVPARAGISIKNVPNDAKAVFGLGRPCFFTAAKYASYQSYGFDGGLGLQIGQEDAENFAAGIEYLLSHKEYHDKNFQLIYFYDKEVDNVIMESLMNGTDVSDDDLSALEDSVMIHKSVLSDILSAVISGKEPHFADSDAEYYMAKFVCPASRYYLSHAVKGRYVDLLKNLCQWYSDTLIDTGFAKKCAVKFYGLLMKCVSKPTVSKVAEQVEKEFSDVKFSLLTAIYQNQQIPYLLYDRAVGRVVTDVSSKKNPLLDVYVQIIKCYLLRKGYEIMPEVTCNVSPAYACGKLFAAYEQIQWLYNRGDVNKNLAQSYFAAVMKQPGAIFPKIAELGTVYFNKLSDGSKSYFTDVFGEISAEIGSTFPAVFSDVDKGAFVLGYYQQKAAFKKRNTDKKLSTDIDVKKENEDE